MEQHYSVGRGGKRRIEIVYDLQGIYPVFLEGHKYQTNGTEKTFFMFPMFLTDCISIDLKAGFVSKTKFCDQLQWILCRLFSEKLNRVA